jgi:hypothetical protein
VAATAVRDLPRAVMYTTGALGTGACEAHDEAGAAQAVQAGPDSTVCLDRVLEGEEPSAGHSLVRQGLQPRGKCPQIIDGDSLDTCAETLVELEDLVCPGCGGAVLAEPPRDAPESRVLHNDGSALCGGSAC